MIEETLVDRENYTPTEIGFLPHEWHLSKIGDLFDIQQGASMSPKRREGKSPYPFLRTMNVLWGDINLSTLDQMDFTDAEVEKLELRPGDLLVCEGGDIGRTAIWNGSVSPCC